MQHEPGRTPAWAASWRSSPPAAAGRSSQDAEQPTDSQLDPVLASPSDVLAVQSSIATASAIAIRVNASNAGIARRAHGESSSSKSGTGSQTGSPNGGLSLVTEDHDT
jgi:hypothetical protein